MKEKKGTRKSDKKLCDENIKQAITESSDGELTLQQIGDMFDITRMRVCQIEKASLRKLASLDLLKIIS